MITSKVTKKQLEDWKEIYEFKRSLIKPNRISGAKLNDYFVKKYAPKMLKSDKFKNVVFLNAKENGAEEANISEIVTYVVNDNVFVGIDLMSGYFHVECEETCKAVQIWDDLFVKRGLSENDLKNYVLTAQYILLANI